MNSVNFFTLAIEKVAICNFLEVVSGIWNDVCLFLEWMNIKEDF